MGLTDSSPLRSTHVAKSPCTRRPLCKATNAASMLLGGNRRRRIHLHNEQTGTPPNAAPPTPSAVQYLTHRSPVRLEILRIQAPAIQEKVPSFAPCSANPHPKDLPTSTSTIATIGHSQPQPRQSPATSAPGKRHGCVTTPASAFHTDDTTAVMLPSPVLTLPWIPCSDDRQRQLRALGFRAPREQRRISHTLLVLVLTIGPAGLSLELPAPCANRPCSV